MKTCNRNFSRTTKTQRISLKPITLSLIGILLSGMISLFGQTKVVFSENFDNATSTQPWLPYKSTGWFNNGNTLQSVSGKGKVLHINFPANTVGVEHGLGNYRIPLDSAYKELYLSWEYFLPANFDFGWADKLGGGKFFGGFAGGSMTAIPNLDATDVDGWASILMFQDGTSSTYNYFKGTTFSPGGWPYGVILGPITKGQWRRMTIRLKINDGDQSNGIFEVYDNDKLVHQLPNAKIVNSSHPEYLIEHIYLNSFFGGSGKEYVSPINQFMEFDNLVAFYYPKGSSGYRSGASESGRVLQVPAATSYHPVPPNKFTPATYTESNGTLTSHCGYYQAVDHFDYFETSTIQVAGATSLNINITKFTYDGGINYIGYKQILKIYQGTGSGRVLKQTYQNGINTTPGSLNISGNSATIEWQAGQGSNGGFTLNYTSNGTGSGKNFSCGNCFAKQGSAIPVSVSIPAAPANLTFSDLTDRSLTLKWTDNSNNESYFEIERSGPNSATTIEKFQSGANTATIASSGLIGNSTYTYKIRAYNASGYSAYSNTIQVITNYALPNPPSGLISTSVTFNTVSLKWTDNSGIEDGFKVERSLSSTTGFSEIATVSANVTTYTNTTCNASTTYYYRVKAYNPAGNTACTPVLAATTANNVSATPAPPANLSYNNLTDRSLTLIWTDISNNETSFEIERTGPNSSTTIQKFQSGANTVSFDIAGLIGNSVYTFKIRSYNASGFSAYSNTIQVTTNYALPNAPSALASTEITDKSIGLKWTDNSGIEDGFKIERSVSSTTGFTEIAILATNTTSYINNTCGSSTTYYYRVRAFNPAGNTAYTPVISATTSGNTLISGLIAHYTFENSGSDVSGNGHSGTLVNGASYTSSSKEASFSLSLDGSNDYANLGMVDLGNQFTIATWVYIPSGYSNIRTIVSNTGSGDKTDGFKLFINTYGTTDRKIIIETGNGSQSATAMTAASTFNFNCWNHIAIVVNRTTGQAIIYLNGTNVTSISGILNNFSTNRSIWLGTMTNSVFPMPGNLDDTRFYNRMLSASEINGLINLPTLKMTEAVFTNESHSLLSENIPVVFPNPFTDHLNIHSNLRIKEIRVYTMLGIKAYEQLDINSNDLIINELDVKSSLYLVNILLENNEMHVIKVVRKDF